MSKPGYQLTGHLLAAASTVVWSSAFVINKSLFNGGVDPVLVILIRQTVAAILICGLCLRLPRRGESMKLLQRLRRDKLLIIAGVLGVAVYYLLDNYSVKNTFAANASLLLTTSPVFAAMIGRYILRDGQKLGGGFIFGTLCCFTGAAVIIFNGSFTLQLSPLGDLLAIAASMVWAVYSILVNKINEENALLERPRSQLEIIRVMFISGALFMWLFCLLTAKDLRGMAAYSPAQWGMMIYLSIMASFLCLLIWNISIVRIGVVKCSLYMFVTPLLVILASAMFLNERLTLVAGLGAAILLIGMAFAQGFARLVIDKLRRPRIND